MPKHSKTNRGYSSRDSEGSVKAVLVGINYRGTSNALGGCINDVLTTQKRILAEYPSASIELMTDDTPIKPTRNNILSKLKNLVDNSQAGDILMFHYSGHGSQREDFEGDEEDGLDETICPIDFMTPMTITVNGITHRVDSQITDDEIHEIISHTPRGVKFLMLSDSCHSGTIGDLKYDFAHYNSSSSWVGDETVSNNSSGCSSSGQAVPTQPSMQPVQPALNSVNCVTAWVYAKYLNQLSLTPLNSSVYGRFGSKKIVVGVAGDLPAKLTSNPNKVLTFDTSFRKLANGQYEISSEELGINGLVVNLSQRESLQRDLYFGDNFQFSRNAASPETAAVNSAVKYSYDHHTGKHCHCCGSKKGGELRIISGCEEDQTSADTGRNGACTNTFWTTVTSIGGLHNFFPKIFSHNVEDLKFIQDSINSNLSRFGFTQHSVVSWDHANAATRALEFMPQQIQAATRTLRTSYVPQRAYVPSYSNSYQSQRPSFVNFGYNRAATYGYSNYQGDTVIPMQTEELSQYVNVPVYRYIVR